MEKTCIYTLCKKRIAPVLFTNCKFITCLENIIAIYFLMLNFSEFKTDFFWNGKLTYF